MTRILSPTPQNIARIGRALAEGEVIGMPTETVYGLAGAAFQPEALARIFETKERPTFDPLIIHITPLTSTSNLPSLMHLEELGLVAASSMSAQARQNAEKIIQKFWPGPLTLVLPKSAQVPDLATSGLPTVAVRMPRHPIAQAIIRAAGTPLAAPSANRFGRISPTSAQDVFAELSGRISWIVDGGSCEIGLESTIVDLSASGKLTLLRPGGTAGELIEQVTGEKLHHFKPELRTGTRTTEKAQPAPGMLLSHYAPVKGMRMLPFRLAEASDEGIRNYFKGFGKNEILGILLLSGDPSRAIQRIGPSCIVYSLSADGDPASLARNLFCQMRALDSSAATLLFTEPCTGETGLLFAVRDRLTRACVRSPS